MLIVNNGVVSDDEYRTNQATIQQAQALVDSANAANEEGKRRYEERLALVRKIEEGKRAEAVLQAMLDDANGSASRRTLAIAGPPTQHQVSSPASAQTQKSTSHMVPRIVEVPHHIGPPQPAGIVQSPSHWTPYGAHGYPPAGTSPHYGYAPTLSSGQLRGDSPMWHSQPPSQKLPSNPQLTLPRQGTAVRTQRRQALPMQPIGQSQSTIHANPQQLGSRGTVNQRTLVGQQPVMQHVASTQNVISTSTPSGPSIPNVVAHPYYPTNRASAPITFPTSSSSSSLAGALDLERARGGSNLPTFVQPLSQLTPLGTAVSNLQEQLNVASTPASSSPSARPENSVTVPSSNLGALNSTEGNAAMPSPAVSIEKFATDFFSGPDWKRASSAIEAWSSTTTDTILPLNNSLHVYKDDQQRLYLGVPVPQLPGKFIRIPVPPSTVKPLSQTYSVKPDSLPPPLTAEQRKKYHPYSIPPHPALNQSYPSTLASQSVSREPSGEQSHATSLQSSTPQSTSGIQASTTKATAKQLILPPTPGKLSSDAGSSGAAPTTMPILSISAMNGPRTPAQADKRSIARDILRALNSKRPRPADGSDAGLEPPVKRHATQDAPQQPIPASSAQRANKTAPNPVSESALIAQPKSIQSTLPTEGAVIPQSSLDRLLEIPANTGITPASKPDINGHSKQDGPSALRPQEILRAVDYYPNLKYQHSTVESSRTYYRIPPAGNNIYINTPDSLPTAVAGPSSSKLSEGTARSDGGSGKVPLFLPSPSPSPVADAAGHPLVNDYRLVKRGQPFYILIPPPPDHVKKYKAQQLKIRQREIVDDSVSGLESRASSSRLLEDSEDIFDVDPSSNGFVNGDLERQAVLLSCSRLCARSCKWSGCEAILNSAEKLIAHFLSAHKPDDKSKNLFTCSWQQCGRHEITASRLFYHLRNHAVIPLLCAYDDCDDSFRTARQLLKHHEMEHLGDPEKASAALFVPSLVTPPPIPSGLVPSYLIEPVQQPSISRTRHNILGPSVLLKIAGPVKRTKRYNAASKLLRSASEGDESRRLDSDPYDFLTFPSTNFSTTPSQPSKIRDMDDLESGEVSEFAHYNGIMLWDDSDDEEQSDLFGSPLPGPVGATLGRDRGQSLGTNNEEVAGKLTLSVPQDMPVVSDVVSDALVP